MSVLNRISTILRANINDLLDRAEDPAKLLNQIIREMGEALTEAKKQVTEAIAQGKLLEADLKQARNLATQWQQKAQLAVTRGADDLARECLRRKHDYDSNVQVYEDQVTAHQANVSRLTGELKLLEAKYAEVQRNRESLLARYQTAKASQQLSKGLASVSVQDPGGALNQMEQRIRLMEARSAAAGELAAGDLEAQLSQLTASSADLEIEAELLSLKSGQRLLPSPK